MSASTSTRRAILSGGTILGLGLIAELVGRPAPTSAKTMPSASAPEHFAVTHTDAEWRAMLSPEAYDVLRHQGTEMPFSSPLDTEFGSGTYHCAGCSQPLYSSSTKFDSGTGWPSFWQPLPNAVGRSSDSSLMFERTEIHCSRCGGHLGHVFADGPKPTGLRYCMDGVALKFQAA